MTKAELIGVIAKDADISKAAAAKALDCYVKTVAAELKKNGNPLRPLTPPARPAPISTPRRGFSWVLADQPPENPTRYSTSEIAALLRETLDAVPSD